MKKSRFLITCLLILVLALSISVLGACDWINGSNDDPPKNDVPGGGDTVICSVTYVSGADDATGTAPDAATYASGREITLAANPFTREGYYFEGWSDGSEVYSAGAKYVVTESNVVFTAIWKAVAEDVPTLSELDNSFYISKNWQYMTNDDGASLDGGDIPYSMADGSIKFHRANQAFLAGDYTNSTASFMLKGTNDWSIWFNSSSKDNANNSSYRLAYAYGGLRLVLSSAPELAAANVDPEGKLYNKGEWNRFDVVFSTTDGVCDIKVYINGERADLTAGENTTPAISVANNVLTHTQPAMFTTGNYMVVKVWEAHNYVQLKPVAKAEEEDLPIIACIGASITEGAGASNFYTESYPAQLQNALAGLYNVVNFGNSGKTVREDLGDDVAWLKQYQWQGVKAIVPDIAILNIGTNDSKSTNDPLSTYESFYEAYMNLINKLLEVNPDMQIIICTVPYAYSDIWGINNDNIANIIAPVQRDIAEEKGYTLIDLYEYSQDKAHLFPDGVHPNTKGYEMFVKIIKKALLEGGDALTEEFIAGINEEYGPKVPNAYVEVDSVVIKDMTLTITGKTNDKDLQLYVGHTPGDDTVYNSYTNLTFDEEGDGFTVDFDLTTMPIGGWYNVRLYFTDGNYYTISLNELTDGEGGTYGLWSHIPLETTQVQICSWDEGTIPTLSFAVKEYTKPTHTISVSGGSITATGDQIILTVTGSTTDTNAVLLAGPEDNVELYGHALTIAEDGSFTVSFDLASLEASTSWQNVKLYMSDGNYIVVPYDLLGVNVDDVFYTSNKKVTVKTWGGEKITSLLVENYDPSYTLTATEVKFENGKLVFSGTTTNVRTLTAYLYNTSEGIDSYSADAVIAEDGSFTVEIALDQLTMAAGNWYYLWTSANGGDLTKVVYTDYDSSFKYSYGYRTYKWEYWEGIAVNYSNTGYAYTITNATITEVDGKATLTVEGTTNDSSIAAESLTLRLDKTSETKEQIDVVNQATEAGHFKFVYDISGLIGSTVETNTKEEGYFIRLFKDGAKLADINSSFVSNDLFKKVGIGNDTYYFYRNNASAYYTLGIVKFEDMVVEEDEIYDYYLVGGQISATNMPFTLSQEDDKVYVNFSGTYGANSKVERTIELILTLEDPADQPESLDSSKILYTAQNTYSGDETNGFAFKINATDDVGIQGGWIRFVMKVTEGDTVIYYTIKPLVESHSGDWIACGAPISLDGVKYELAICWSSVFVQVISA